MSKDKIRFIIEFNKDNAVMNGREIKASLKRLMTRLQKLDNDVLSHWEEEL